MNLLFDLDGTLTDPLPGIARSIQHAVISLGGTPPEIVDHFDLRRFFRAVYGSELDGHLVERSDLIRVVLGRENLNSSDTWMIGDRAADILGGRQNGLRTAGVLWGYGVEDEVERAQPDLLARTVVDLRAIVSVD